MASAAALTTFWSGLSIPAAPSINAAASKDRALAAAGARSAVPLTYGEDRLGALILNVLPAGAGSTTLLVQCLWGFACDSVWDLRLNDLVLPAGSSATHYTGAQATADSTMVSAFSAQGLSYTDILAGYAYSVISMPVRNFDGQLNISARVRGRKLYDPRLDSTAGGAGSHRLATPSTWAWSDNPALALADFIYNSALYGLNRPVNWTSVQGAASHADALIGAPAEKRRTVGVSFILPTRASDVVEALRAYAGCFITGGAPSISLLADQDQSALASYSHASGEIAAVSGLSKRDLSAQPTAVEVVYTDTAAIPWREASVTAQLAGAGTTRPWRLSQVRLPGVQRGTQANREAIERLNKLTGTALGMSLEVFDIGLRHEVGDIITVTHPLGLSAKPMRVLSVDMPGPGRWRLGLAEHSAAVYSVAVVSPPATQDSGYVSQPGPPSNVQNLTASVVGGGVLIAWAANQQRDYHITELRYGASWAAGAPIWAGSATSFEWAPPAGATPLVWVSHISRSGVVGDAASVAVTISTGSISGLTATFVGPDLRLDYVGTVGALLIDRFRIRFGAEWAAGTEIGDYKVTRLDRRADWLGLRRWWVAAVDASGAIGAPVSIDVTVTEPGAVISARSETVDNNVLLYWSPPATGSLPVERYEVRKGATWAGGAAIGSNGNSTFAAVFEQQAGVYGYWVAAYDSAGNVGTPVVIGATVSQPPDYVLRANLDDDFASAALSNMYMNGGRVTGPALLESIQTHFESRSWATPDAQIVAGFPLVFQPSGTSGYYERVVDYGAALPSTTITVAPITVVVTGAVTMVVQISFKTLAGDAYTDATAGATQVLAGNFRYVKVRLTFTAAGGDDLIEMSALNIKLNSKLKTDSGDGTAVSTDSGGTTVTFGATFIDVSSIVVTPSGTTARYAIYDFVDVPNPTTFKVLLFDSLGVRASGVFSWTARGS